MQDPCSLNTFEPWMLIYVASWWFQIRLFLRWWSTLTFVSLGPVWLIHGSVHGPWIDFKSILEEYLVPDPHPTLKLQVNSTYPWNILHVLRAPSGPRIELLHDSATHLNHTGQSLILHWWPRNYHCKGIDTFGSPENMDVRMRQVDLPTRPGTFDWRKKRWLHTPRII